MKVTIEKYREVLKNTLRGFCTVVIDDLIAVQDCSHHKKNDKEWVNLPSKGYEHDGESKYYSLVRFVNKEDYWDFQNACKKALAKHFDDEKLGTAWSGEAEQEVKEATPF